MICYNKGYPLGLISSGSVFGVKCIILVRVMLCTSTGCHPHLIQFAL